MEAFFIKTIAHKLTILAPLASGSHTWTGAILLACVFFLNSSVAPAQTAPGQVPQGVLVRRGKEIKLPAAPKRIVALGPSVSETVVALGALDRLVGRSRFCNRSPELQKVPDMGGISDPSLEKLLETRPDL